MLGRSAAPCHSYVWWLLGVLLASMPLAPVRAQDEVKKESRFITVPNPITGTTVEQIKSTIERIRTQPNTKLEKVVFAFNPEGQEASSTSYGNCYDLARYIHELNLNGVYTFAFLENKTTGHTVLPVLACSELAMTPENSAIGQVTGPQVALPPQGEIETYLKMGKPELAGLILKMIDPKTDVYSGLLNQATIYFDGRRLKDPEYANVLNPQRVGQLNPGQVELYNERVARRFNLCQSSPESKQKLAEDNGINLIGDMPQGKAQACKIDVVGAIDDALKDKIFRQLREAKSRKDNTIFLVLNSDGGGDAKAAHEIAVEISELQDFDKNPIRTIAFIPNSAPDLATIVALGCSEIAMFAGSQPDKEATIGDFEHFLNNPQAVDGGSLDYLKKNLPDLLKTRGLAPALAEGLLDKDTEIVRVLNQKTGARSIMTKTEFNRRNGDARDWQLESVLKQPGTYLKLKATQAKQLRIANVLVNNKEPKEVYAKYGFEEKDVLDAKPHWLDNLAAVLRRTDVSILLVLIGISGLILELKIPGLTVPGIIAAICFVLFFWAQSQMNGQIIYLAILLFMLGIVLIGIEIFLLPGFGAPGVSGVLLVIAGLGLATIDHIPQSSQEWIKLGGKMSLFGGSMVGSVFIVMLVGRFLPKIPFANRMILTPPTDQPETDSEFTPLPGVEAAAALLGAVGTATSTLRPAGLAKINDQFIDVVSEGDFIDAGTSVQVVEVEGTRIVVRRIG